jgi:bifunctional DNA-binding transcriptional regulator/antitoxin component of YhaV-PrlF toxin-antitoxin module
MVNIAVLKVDRRGRVGIPTTFLKSNGLNPLSGNCVAVMKPKYGTTDVEITLEFIEQVETNSSTITPDVTKGIATFSEDSRANLMSNEVRQDSHFNDVT